MSVPRSTSRRRRTAGWAVVLAAAGFAGLAPPAGHGQGRAPTGGVPDGPTSGPTDGAAPSGPTDLGGGERPALVLPTDSLLVRLDPRGFDLEAALGEEAVRGILTATEEVDGGPLNDGVRAIAPLTRTWPADAGPIDVTFAAGEALVVTVQPRAAGDTVATYAALTDLAAILGLPAISRPDATFFTPLAEDDDAAEEMDALQADRFRPWQEAFARHAGSHVRFAYIPSLLDRKTFRDDADDVERETGLPATLERDVLYLSGGLRLAADRPAENALTVRLACRDAAAAARTEPVARYLLERSREAAAPASAALAGLLGAAAVGVDGSDVVVRVALTPERLAAVRGPLLGDAGLSAGLGHLTSARDNFRQVLIALHNFHDTHGHFPPMPGGAPPTPLSWRVAILPFLDQKPLYDAFHHDEPWDSEHNLTLVERMPAVYADPLQAVPPGRTTTQVPVGPGLFGAGGSGIAMSAITDGTSNTIAIVQRPAADAVPWTKPADWEVDPAASPAEALLGGGAGRPPRDTVFVGMADGSTRTLSAGLAEDVLRGALTRGGGEPIALPESQDGELGAFFQALMTRMAESLGEHPYRAAGP